MNHVRNDMGEMVVAVGNNISVARARVRWPKLIGELNALYYEAKAYRYAGVGIDIAIEKIREAGVTGKYETRAILEATQYVNEPDGSATSIVRRV